MDINTLLFKAKVAESKALGCWECPHLKPAGQASVFCLKHNATINDRLKATYFVMDRKKEYCVVQCDEPQVIAIERKSW